MSGPKEKGTMKKATKKLRPRNFVLVDGELVDAGPLYLDLKAEARRRGLSATGYLRQILYRELREKKSDAA
jgi:hypothetical protein